MPSYDHTREGAAAGPHTRIRKEAYRWLLGTAALPIPSVKGLVPFSHKTGALNKDSGASLGLWLLVSLSLAGCSGLARAAACPLQDSW